jgi:hypothetical protein
MKAFNLEKKVDLTLLKAVQAVLLSFANHTCQATLLQLSWKKGQLKGLSYEIDFENVDEN